MFRHDPPFVSGKHRLVVHAQVAVCGSVIFENAVQVV
jgi:hypothetical protein